MFDKTTLMNQIRAMGIVSTDTVLIHTSLRAVGPVENGADGVIDAFREVLCDGLFLVPTHTWANVNRRQPVYDAAVTVPCIGTLPRVAAFRPDGIRSLHPTHSIWASGRGAEDFVRGEEHAQTPAPPVFAWSRLADVGAKILLIGVGHERNTFIHAIDELADIPDRLDSPSWEVTVCSGHSEIARHPFVGHRTSYCDAVSERFGIFEKPLIELGAQTFGQLGNAAVRVIDAARCRDIILRIYSRTQTDLCRDPQELPESLYR